MNRALLAAAATGLQVGTSLVASEAVVGEVGAGWLGFLRYAVALCFLLPFAFASSSRPFAGRDILPVALLGIGQFGLLIALLNLAVLFSTSARVSLVFATLPLMTLVVGWMLKGAAVSRRDTAAIVVSVIGAAVLLGGDAVSGSLAPGELLGLGCAALATLTGAVCSSLYRPYLERYGVTRVSVVAMAASLPPLGVLALVEGAPAPVADWTTGTFALIAFVGLSSGIGYLLWLFALTKAPPGIVTAFLALSPISAVCFSVIFLGAQVTVPILIALVLILGALLVTAIGPRRLARTG